MARERGTNEPVIPGPGRTVYLTPRQAKVLELAGRGLGDKEIAADLGLSRRTVEDRFDEMRKRTGARTRGELLARATAAGLVQLALATSPAGSSGGPGQSRGPRRQRSAGKRSTRTPLTGQGITASQPQAQHFVGNKTLRTRGAGMAGLPGDRRKPRMLLPEGGGRVTAFGRVPARPPELSDGARTAGRVVNLAPSWPGYPMRGEPPASAQDVLGALCQIRAERARLEHAERALIDIARCHAVTWLEISRALGVGTAQAAQQRRKRLGDPWLPDGACPERDGRRRKLAARAARTGL